MKNVLLLRVRAEDGPDRYEAAFEAKGYTPLSVPVLETVLVHIDVLRDKIIHGPDMQGISGVIMTSKRAVDAWCDAIRSIQPTAGSVQGDWRSVPFYVVGDATAAAASQIHTTMNVARLAPGEDQIRGGAETGTAEQLAEFILRERNDSDRYDVIYKGRRLLYLTGDKNRETLSQKLAAGGFTLETLEVYGTTGSSTFRDDLGTALELAPVGDSGKWGWVVYFAPSAAAFVAPMLHEVFRPDALKIAVIGSTTASFVRETLKMWVDVVATKPTPDALCDVVVAFDDAANVA